MIVGSTKLSSRHWKLKERALKLRSNGLSYNEILKKIPVAKSTVSLWCRYVKLTTAQRKILDNRKYNGLAGIKAIQNIFWGRRCEAFLSGVSLSNRLKKRDTRFIAGLMLYWAEGSKSSGGASIANSDPRIIKFMVRWFNEFFEIKPEEFTIHLHLHSGQDENKMKFYWSKITDVPLQNFCKSFVKPEGSGYRKNILYNGTVKLTVKRKGSTYLLFKILGGINGFLSLVINEPIKPENWMKRLPYADGSLV